MEITERKKTNKHELAQLEIICYAEQQKSIGPILVFYLGMLSDLRAKVQKVDDNKSMRLSNIRPYTFILNNDSSRKQGLHIFKDFQEQKWIP